jgi:hypothetical protein
MNFRLVLFGLSSALMLGHLFHYFPALRQGVSLTIGILAVAVTIAAAAGVMAMFMSRRYLSRIDLIMGMLPGAIVGMAVLGVIVIGGLI